MIADAAPRPVSPATRAPRLRAVTGLGQAVVPTFGPVLGQTRPVMGAERRRAPRRPAFVTPQGVRVEALSFDVAALHRDAWLELAGQAIEPNPFFDPDFALAAARHLPVSQRPQFLLARGLVDGRMRLMGLLPLAPGRGRLTGVAQAWTHPYAAMGAPLLDAARPADALGALLGWIGAKNPRAGAVVLPALDRDGATTALLRRAALVEGRPLRLIDPRERAALRFDADRAAPAANKNMRRLARRLAEQGDLAFRLIDDPADVRDGFERFMALEAAGWKGERGTALVNDAGSAAFGRAAVRMMARRRAARLAALTLDGVEIALGVVFVTGGVAAFWKIAHDPAYARFSPGVQLSLRLSEALADDPAITLADSCAGEDHPMIDRLWTGRRAIVDVVTAAPGAPRADARFRFSLARERALRAARAAFKRAFRVLAGRREV